MGCEVDADCLMLPGIDNANHTAEGEQHFHWISDAAQMRAVMVCSVEEGEEVLFSYGAKSSGDMICSYGYQIHEYLLAKPFRGLIHQVFTLMKNGYITL